MRGNPIEEVKPDEVAELILSWAENPSLNIAAKARACGLNVRTAQSIIKKLETRYQPVAAEVRKLTSDRIVELIEDKIPILMDAITPEKVKEATLRDAVLGLGVLIDKRQLLRGEPTQIMTYEDRQSLNELLPGLLREAERRGMTIDATYQEVPEVKVLTPEKPHAEGLSKTAAATARRKRRSARK